MCERQDAEWVELRRARDRRLLEEATLVLAATGVPHRLEMEERRWRLLVPASEAPAARAELARYEEENRPPVRMRPRLHIFDSGWVGVLVYLLLIWLLPNLEGRSAFGWHWQEIGLMDAELVRDGQWWRAITALTLHADLGHLAGNSFFGALFGLFVGRFLGTGFGWLLVLLGGFLGNLANAWLQTPPFASLGASTATFAALGLIGAFVWRRGFLRSGDWRRNFAPLFAAIALLAYTGIGGERTDVLGHFLGFAAGAVGGLLASSFDIRRLGKSGQWIAGILALWLVGYAWLQAGSQGIAIEPNGAPTAAHNLIAAGWAGRDVEAADAQIRALDAFPKATLAHAAAPLGQAKRSGFSARSRLAARANSASSRPGWPSRFRPAGGSSPKCMGMEMAQVSRKLATEGLRSAKRFRRAYSPSSASADSLGAIMGAVG